MSIENAGEGYKLDILRPEDVNVVRPSDSQDNLLLDTPMPESFEELEMRALIPRHPILASEGAENKDNQDAKWDPKEEMLSLPQEDSDTPTEQKKEDFRPV